MRTFIVHRKKGESLRYQAYGYSEDPDASRIFFHKKEDKSDRDCFVMLGEISGVDEESSPVQEIDFDEQLRSSPALREALRRKLDQAEKTDAPKKA